MNDFWIKRFKEEALTKIIEEFHPKKVILFGSHITGEASEESDIDVIVVAETFREIHFLKRIPMVVRKNQISKTCRLYMLLPRGLIRRFIYLLFF